MNTNGIQKVEKTFEIKGPKIITKPKALLVALFVPLLPFGGWLYYSEKCEAVRMLLRLGGKKIGLVECALYDVMILPTIVLLGSGVLLLAIPFMLWIAFSSKSFNIMLLPTTLQVPQIGLPIYSSTPIVIRPWANSTSVPYEDIENVFSGKSPVYGRYLCITRSSEVDLIFPFTLFESEAEQQLLEKMLLASIEARKSSSSDNIRSRASGDAHVAVPVTKKTLSARREADGAKEREVPWRERLSAMEVDTSVEIEGLVLWKLRNSDGNEYFSGLGRYETVDQVMNAYGIR